MTKIGRDGGARRALLPTSFLNDNVERFSLGGAAHKATQPRPPRLGSAPVSEKRVALNRCPAAWAMGVESRGILC
jgi:hypothetical protein